MESPCDSQTPEDPVPDGEDGDLRALLAPVTPERFLSEYWENKALFIAGPGKLPGLFSRQAFERAAGTRGVILTASSDRGRTVRAMKAADIDRVFAAGATVCATSIERGDAVLARWVARIRRQLGFVGIASVRAYLSPDGSGYGVHFDRRIATTIQIEGEKVWRYSEYPAISHPDFQVISDGAGGYTDGGAVGAARPPWRKYQPPDTSKFVEATLGPGDVLCLPAGNWHEARARGYSLALNVSFEPLSMWELLGATIGPKLRWRPEWRRGPSPVRGSPRDRIPQAVQQFLGERLSELAAVTSQVDVEELWRRWREGADDGRPPEV